MSEPEIYEARHAPCRPTDDNRHWGGTFSVGIGEVVPEGKRMPAAIYRVWGNVDDEEQVDALAWRLVEWLNWRDRRADGSGASRVLRDHDRSARIKLTPAGKKAGFLR